VAVITAVFVLSAQALTAFADNIATADYTLSITNGTAIPDPGQKPSDDTTLGQVVQTGIANGTFPQVTATISPAGSVQPTDPSAGPLTILGGSGFSQSGLVDALNGDGSKLGLIFFNGGLAANGSLHFALDVNTALSSTPPIVTSTTPGVSITPDSSTFTPTSAEQTVTPQSIPEPMSVLVWTGLAGFGVFRARAIRRSRLTPADS
jgi:hypothetical protein